MTESGWSRGNGVTASSGSYSTWAVFVIIVFCLLLVLLSSSHIFLLILLFSFVRNYLQVDVLVGVHPWRPSGSQLGQEKRCDKSFQAWSENPQWTANYLKFSKSPCLSSQFTESVSLALCSYINDLFILSKASLILRCPRFFMPPSLVFLKGTAKTTSDVWKSAFANEMGQTWRLIELRVVCM